MVPAYRGALGYYLFHHTPRPYLWRPSTVPPPRSHTLDLNGKGGGLSNLATLQRVEMVDRLPGLACAVLCSMLRTLSPRLQHELLAIRNVLWPEGAASCKPSAALPNCHPLVLWLLKTEAYLCTWWSKHKETATQKKKASLLALAANHQLAAFLLPSGSASKPPRTLTGEKRRDRPRNGSNGIQSATAFVFQSSSFMTTATILSDAAEYQSTFQHPKISFPPVETWTCLKYRTPVHLKPLKNGYQQHKKKTTYRRTCETNIPPPPRQLLSAARGSGQLSPRIKRSERSRSCNQNTWNQRSLSKTPCPAST